MSFHRRGSFLTRFLLMGVACFIAVGSLAGPEEDAFYDQPHDRGNQERLVKKWMYHREFHEHYRNEYPKWAKHPDDDRLKIMSRLALKIFQEQEGWFWDRSAAFDQNLLSAEEANDLQLPVPSDEFLPTDGIVSLAIAMEEANSPTESVQSQESLGSVDGVGVEQALVAAGGAKGAELVATQSSSEQNAPQEESRLQQMAADPVSALANYSDIPVVDMDLPEYAYEVPEEFRLPEGYEVAAPRDKQIASASRGVAPVFDFFLRSLVVFLKLDKQHVFGAQSTKHATSLYPVPDHNTRLSELIEAFRLIKAVYSERAARPPRPLKSFQEVAMAFNPTVGLGHSQRDSFKATLKASRAGKVFPALDPSAIDDLEGTFGGNKDLQEKAQELIDRRQLRRAQMMDFLNRAGDDGDSTMSGSLLTSMLSAIVTAVPSNTDAAILATELAAQGIRALGPELRAMARGEAKSGENGETMLPEERLARGLESSAGAVRNVQEILGSDKAILSTVDQVLELWDDGHKTAVSAIFKRFEDSVNNLLRSELSRIPERILDSSLGNGLPQRFGAGVDESEDLGAEVARLVFVDLLQDAPRERLQDLFMALMTMGANYDEDESVEMACFQALVELGIGPVEQNVLQQLLQDSQNSFLQNIAEMTQTDGLSDPPSAIVRTLRQDSAELLKKTKYVDLKDPSVVREIEKTNWKEDGTVYNLQFHPIGAGKAVQVTTLYKVVNNKLKKFVVRIPKADVEKLLKYSAVTLYKRISSLASVVRWDADPSRTASLNAMRGLVGYYFEAIGRELAAGPEAELSHNITSMRHSARQLVPINGEDRLIQVYGSPMVASPHPKSRLLFVEFVPEFERDGFEHQDPARGIINASLKLTAETYWNEVFFNHLGVHPMLKKTFEYARKKGIELEGTYPNLRLANSDDANVVIDTEKLFGYKAMISTLGEHMELLRKAQLTEGAGSADVHDGNVRVHPWSPSGGGASHIDNSQIDWLAGDQKKYLNMIFIGFSIKDMSLIERGVYGLTVKPDFRNREAQSSFQHDVVFATVRRVLRIYGRQVSDPGDLLRVLYLFYEIPLPPSLFGFYRSSMGVWHLYVRSFGGNKERASEEHERWVKERLKGNRTAMINSGGVGVVRAALGATSGPAAKCVDWLSGDRGLPPEMKKYPRK